MANKNFTEWYIAGLHALRSASEQGSEAASELQAGTTSEEIKSLLVEYQRIAAEQQQNYVGFLKALDTEPTGFKDRIMEGVGSGTDEMVKAAPDQDLVDLSAISGSVSGLDYYVGAFKDQGALASRLGLHEQSATMQSMGQAAQQLRDRFFAVAEKVRAKASVDA